MKIKVDTGTADRRNVQLFVEAAFFVLDHLLDDCELLHIDLHILFTQLSDVDGDIELHTSPVYRLRLSSDLDTIRQLLTLCHELVHLVQSVKGRLTFDHSGENPRWAWDGNDYGTDPYSRPVSELPWEIDALNTEVKLLTKFLNEICLNLNLT